VSKRNFPDFITAYFQYAQDNFCPDKFHFWTGISLIAGALERKTYIVQDKYRFYPNLYIMLVSGPGMGKSSAMQIGVNGIFNKLDNMNFIPQHITEAKLVEDLARQKVFYKGNKEFIHSSSYWYISEGSNVLAERKSAGDLIPMITEIYDCPGVFAKGTKADGSTKIVNACLNMLSGVTFDFAKRLILGQNSAGGFSSRNIYVIHNKVMVRNPHWENMALDTNMQADLIHDLSEINKMVGQFKLDKDFKQAYLDWFPVNDKRNQELKSSILRDFMARNHTNAFKLAQIFSASESNEMLITKDHWDKAIDVLTKVNNELPDLIAMGEQAQYGTVGLKHMIVNVIRKHPGVNVKEIQRLMPFGADMRFFKDTLEALGASGVLGNTMINGKAGMIVLNDPQDQL